MINFVRTPREHAEEHGEGHGRQDHHQRQGERQRGKGDFDDDMTRHKVYDEWHKCEIEMREGTTSGGEERRTAFARGGRALARLCHCS